MLLQQGSSDNPRATSSLSGSSAPNIPRSRVHATLSSPDPRLCPRVMVDVDLPQGRTLSAAQVDTAKVVQSYLRSRSPNLTGLDPDMGVLTQKPLQDLVRMRVPERSPFVDDDVIYENQLVHSIGVHSQDKYNSFPVTETAGNNTSAKEKQLTAYVAWVNSQLKKKPGAHLVEDLRHDVRDGVALVDLIEVIAGERLEDVHSAPATYLQMKDNVDKVLQFMSLKKIKMHHITTRDIVDGNLKAIMRLILALAAHYKPNSVRHSAQSNKQQNLAGIAQGAAAALTEARRNATRAGHRHRRRRQREESTDTQLSDSDHSQSHTVSGSGHRKSSTSSRAHPSPHQHHQHHRHHHHYHHHHQPDQRMMGEGESGAIKSGECSGRAELEGASASSSPVSSHNASPRASLYLSDPPSSMEGFLSAGGVYKGPIMLTSCESDNAMGDSGFSEVCDSLKETHQLLFQLHELLLQGDASTEESQSSPGGELEGSNPKETVIILKGRLLHAEEIAESLRSDLNKTKKDCMELQGVKAGLQQRLKEQDTQFSALKSDVMKMELEKENLVLEIEALRKQLGDRELVLADVKASHVKQMEDKDNIIRDLRGKLLEKEHTISVLQETSTMQSQSMTDMSHQDQRITLLVEYLNRLTDVDRSTNPKLSELEATKDSILKARTQVAGQDSQNSIVSSLEDSIVQLLDKFHINGSTVGMTSPGGVSQNVRENAGTTPTKRVTVSQGRRQGVSKDVNKVSPRGRGQSSPNRGSPSRVSPGKTSLVGHQGLMRQPQVSPRASTAAHAITRGTPGKLGRSQIPRPHGSRTKTPSPTISDVQTSVIYYTDGAEKPLTCIIHKKLGDIRLRDFKCVIEDSNLYHYFFKALDPEYGSVKEELCNDDDVLPGWEGKIVAWLEEESGTVC